MDDAKLVRMSFSLEKDLNDKFERLVRENGFENRSEYIRDMIRKRLTQQLCADDRPVIGTISLVFEHHQRGLAEKLLDLQHDCDVDVLAATHVHLSDDICSEMIMVRGIGARIRGLVNSMRRLRGVLQAEFVITSPGEDLHD